LSNLKRHTSHISALLDLALKVLTLDQVGDIILLIIILLLALGLLHVLVGLGELAEGGEAVGAQLVEDTGDELGEFLLLAVAVEGEGVGGDGGVDWLGRCVVSGLVIGEVAVVDEWIGDVGMCNEFVGSSGLDLTRL
jgi:hypothetical protein